MNESRQASRKDAGTQSPTSEVKKDEAGAPAGEAAGSQTGTAGAAVGQQAADAHGKNAGDGDAARNDRPAGIVADDDVLKGTAGARHDDNELVMMAERNTRPMDITDHVAQAGQETMAANAGQPLTKLDITIETFVRAHCNSQGKHIDELEDDLALVFSRACTRVRGVAV